MALEERCGATGLSVVFVTKVANTPNLHIQLICKEMNIQGACLKMP